MHSWKIGLTQQVIRSSLTNGHTNGLRMVRNNTNGSYFLQCCGLAGMENFSSVGQFNDWKDKAGFIACIYRYMYDRGWLVYALSNGQLNNPAHQLFLELGAVQLGESFPNLYHGPNTVHMFRVNIRRACGRFCNKYGEEYDAPPENDSEVNPQEDENQIPYGTLPQHRQGNYER